MNYYLLMTSEGFGTSIVKKNRRTNDAEPNTKSGIRVLKFKTDPFHERRCDWNQTEIPHLTIKTGDTL